MLIKRREFPTSYGPSCMSVLCPQNDVDKEIIKCIVENHCYKHLRKAMKDVSVRPFCYNIETNVKPANDEGDVEVTSVFFTEDGKKVQSTETVIVIYYSLEVKVIDRQDEKSKVIIPDYDL